MKLHNYQERAISFCLDHKAAFLAIDLGMGKTAIALHVIQHIGGPAFVFGPLRTIYSSWPEEIEKWTPNLSYAIAHGTNKYAALNSGADVILMNYDGLNWFSKQKIAMNRRMVIYDESSMCKSHATQRFRLLRKLSILWSDYKLCLSATPAPNSLQELWSQYYLLDSGKALGKNITTFRENYCTSFSYPGMTVTLYKVLARYHKEIYDRVAPITFRLDAKDYLEMPEITYNEIKVELPPSLRAKYKTLKKEFFLELEGADIEALSAVHVGMKLRQFIQGGLYDEEKKWHRLHNLKLRVLKELVETAAGNPILCAIQFKGELAMIREAFPSAPVIAGGTLPEQGAKYITSWNKGNIPLLLCHPASLSHGVNLQAGGHTLLWYGLTWSLEQYSQLNGRLYRQGQLRHVVIHHIIMKDTIDEAVMLALKNKECGLRALLNYIKEYHDE